MVVNLQTRTFVLFQNTKTQRNFVLHINIISHLPQYCHIYTYCADDKNERPLL